MEKKIPKKNYLILTILIVFTVLLTLFLMKTYNNNKKNVSKISFISEIKTNELETYTTESQEAIIYFIKTENEELEKELEKFTKKYNLEDTYVYIDLNNVEDKFYDEFYIKYLPESFNGNFEIKEPSIVIIRNGKVESYLNNIKNIYQIEKFFLENGVIE